MKKKPIPEDISKVVQKLKDENYPNGLLFARGNKITSELCLIIPIKKSVSLLLNNEKISVPAKNAFLYIKGDDVKFSDYKSAVVIKIKKMVVEIIYQSPMPSALICSEDRYGDYHLHLDKDRMVQANDQEALLLVKLMVFSINKLLDNNQRLLQNNAGYSKFLSAMSFVTNNLNKKISRPETAGMLDICPDYLNTLFKKFHGSNFQLYVTARKLELSRELLAQGIKISEIAEQLAFNSDVYYSIQFKKFYGTSPKKIQLLMLKKRRLTIKEYEALYGIVGFTILDCLPETKEAELGTVNPALRSQRENMDPFKNYVIMFDNSSSEKAEIFWLDEKGKRISHGFIEPGKRMESSTQVNRLWVLQSSSKTVVYLTVDSNCTAVFS